MNRYLSILVFAAQLARGEHPASVQPAPPDTVEIVIFSDFQCPFCRQFAQPIRDLMAKAVEGVRTHVTFKNFPLSFHADAQLAAQAAVAAREQGKFWEMHDLIFGNQQAIKREDLLGYAKKLELDMERFRKDLDSERLKQVIAGEQAEGAKLGVSGTPSFFVDGVAYSAPRSYAQLQELTQLTQKQHNRAQALFEIKDSFMSRGPVDAPVTVEFFADLESPVSRPAAAVIEELLSRYPAAIRLQFRSFPLAFHPQAPLAHEAAMAAAKEGHFWEFAEYILAHQDSLREQDLISYAGRLGLNEQAFAEILRQHRYAARVDADVSEGLRRDIHGSPVIFVGGKRIDGVPSLQVLTEYVEGELAKK